MVARSGKEKPVRPPRGVCTGGINDESRTPNFYPICRAPRSSSCSVREQPAAVLWESGEHGCAIAKSTASVMGQII